MKKRMILIFVTIIVIIGIIAIGIYLKPEKEDEITPIITESTELKVEYEEATSSETYTSEITLQDDTVNVSGDGVTVTGSTITIKSAGTYLITGTLTNGNIIIDANSNTDIILILSNVNITSENTAVINGVEANKITITLAENTTNYLTDSNSYSYFTDTESSEPDATIFSKTDLEINGTGKLVINANYLDGIVSKDTLKISDGDITITSNDDGIRGKHYVGINNATINITSNGDGIKSTNTTDTSLGYIKIEDSNIDITTQRDGIQAETIVNTSNSNINIETNGQISNTSEDISSKGIKSGTELTIESGTINITKSYEGIESSYIEINDGDISVISSDDGINISGGNDSSSFNGRPGQNNFSSVGESNQKLTINGGNIYVKVQGDGLDANGSIYINGGNIVVAGPTSSGNGSFDYDSEFIVSGGTVIAYGAKGMWQNPSTSSTQYGIAFDETGSQGDNITIKDSSGNEIANFITDNSYGVIFISSSEIENGETYNLYVNGNSSDNVTVTSTISGGVTSNGMNMQGGGRNQNGGTGMPSQGGGKNR